MLGRARKDRQGLRSADCLGGSQTTRNSGQRYYSDDGGEVQRRERGKRPATQLSKEEVAGFCSIDPIISAVPSSNFVYRCRKVEREQTRGWTTQEKKWTRLETPKLFTRQCCENPAESNKSFGESLFDRRLETTVEPQPQRTSRVRDRNRCARRFVLRQRHKTTTMDGSGRARGRRSGDVEFDDPRRYRRG